MTISISVQFDPGETKKTLDQFVIEVFDDIYKNARDNTPVRTGNARRNWEKDVTGIKKAVVINQVPYIERLEAGASRQAPKGIIGPTLTQIKGKYK
jgi:HK97 gp10 family phage protein